MSPLEQRVTQALGQAQPGAAVDFGVVMQIMSMVLQFIQQCPFGNAKRAIRDGAVEAKVAAYRAVKSSGFAGNAVDLTNALLEQGRQATDDELDATFASAHALPPLVKSVGIVLLGCLMVNSAAIAGPFPGLLHRSSTSGPFPRAVVDSNVLEEVSGDGHTQPADLASRRTTAPSDAPSKRDPRMQASLPAALRTRIGDYAATGGATVGVRGMSITTHLLRDHGWSQAQLAGLTTDELYLLHGMQHAGRIDPRDVGHKPADDNAPVSDGYAVNQAGDSAYWIVDGVRWSNLGGGAPVDGRLYVGGGRSFVYRNGRMHDADEPGSAHHCAGGRCRFR